MDLIIQCEKNYGKRSSIFTNDHGSCINISLKMINISLERKVHSRKCVFIFLSFDYRLVHCYVCCSPPRCAWRCCRQSSPATPWTTHTPQTTTLPPQVTYGHCEGTNHIKIYISSIIVLGFDNINIPLHLGMRMCLPIFEFIQEFSVFGVPPKMETMHDDFYLSAHLSGHHHLPRVQIKVYRGPTKGHHFAPWGYWVKQPHDDHHHHE